MTDELTLEDLAVQSGLTLRTLRFYMQEGLLPGPETRGKYARYSQQHLDRLELIRRMKDLRLPLQEIRQLLDNMSLEEMSQLRRYQDEIARKLNRKMNAMNDLNQINEKPSSALDYIHSIQDGRENFKAYQQPKQPMPMANAVRPLMLKQVTLARPQAPAGQETWRRIQLADGIELNVRETDDQHEKQQLEQLIQSVRKLISGQFKSQGSQ